MFDASKLAPQELSHVCSEAYVAEKFLEDAYKKISSAVDELNNKKNDNNFSEYYEKVLTDEINKFVFALNNLDGTIKFIKFEAKQLTQQERFNYERSN